MKKEQRRQYERPVRAESLGYRDVASIPAAGHQPLQTWDTVSSEPVTSRLAPSML